MLDLAIVFHANRLFSNKEMREVDGTGGRGIGRRGTRDGASDAWSATRGYDRAAAWPATRSLGYGPDMPGIVIVGAGFGGIGMGIALKQVGFHDFVILDQGDDLGGTWRDNQYPGCACDVPSPLYSYSFELNPSWSRLFAPQQEIWDYLRMCTRKYGLVEKHGLDLASAHAAGFDCHINHLLLEAFRELADSCSSDTVPAR